MTPEQKRQCEALGNNYWKENRDYHDSDGVDVHETFSAGFTQGILSEQKRLEGEINKLVSIFEKERDQFEDQVKLLKDALEQTIEVLKAVTEEGNDWSLEQERIGNKAICLPLLRNIEEALEKLTNNPLT